MRDFRRVFLFLLFIPLAAIVGYYLLMLLLAGPALDNFFELKNHDAGTHEVSVEILDSDNKSVFKETYKLRPDESISETKPFNLRNSLESREYTLRVGLDNGVAKEKVSMSLDRHSTATIDIYWDYQDPIIVGAITV